MKYAISADFMRILGKRASSRLNPSGFLPNGTKHEEAVSIIKALKV